MSQLTVRDALAMPVVRNAGPVVVAGADGLDRPLRWVHATELTDIAPLLRAGDLVLMTGIALPESDEGLETFASSLAEVAAAGLMIELGRRWRTDLPTALVKACQLHRLPLVSLTLEVRFAAIIQAVGERIVDEQLTELRNAERVHETFTELGLGDAGPGDILAAVQRLSGAAVVLESDQHQVLDYLAGPGNVSVFLEDWAARSRRVESAERTTWDTANGWLLTRLGTRDRGWGRLVVDCPEPPSRSLVAVAERAAAALTMHRLNDRHRDNLTRRTHHELLSRLLSDPTSSDVLRRCELAGLPIERRQFVGITIRPSVVGDRLTTQGTHSALDNVLAATVHALHQQDVPALVCEMDRDVRALLSLPLESDVAGVVERVAARIAGRHRVVLGAGRAVHRAAQADRTLRESRQVADAVRAPGERTVHRLEDVHLRGLLALLGDDDRLRLFVDRELDALKVHDATHGLGLLDALRALVQHPGSKTDAAAAVHLSRAAFYGRLAQIERVLGADLDDPDVRVSLHVALMADEIRGTGPGSAS
ncbi:PucR family transcriptional regulator [Dactylosporangium fulvum]|uniref:PucR family transcriptional regulator ligand-binding domain-containing protein n=1 Tax=Dactylosporangium fulvum TaxID=53359 RepID=A0ABY5W8M7_9ACTN|nr:PucR family transcriptional regulator ligand-binding domain-containing protein [Dactylosporangium fulvum]UWP85426.1 PucR family transcriptional regulator ligand-binding domain-containing protein [Dactylosporangium fulvum]